jgi:hypothetical protein
MYSTIHRIALLLFVLFTFTGCQSLSPSDVWPEEIPDKRYFVDGYLQKRNLRKVSREKMEAHLTWIKRFYLGTVIYPNGWLIASNSFLDTVEEPEVRSELSQRLEKLGISIANEWAQDNDIRNINNTNIAIWGSALRTAAEREDHVDYISQVERDVAKLLSGELSAREIDYDRYYPEEEYNNF